MNREKILAAERDIVGELLTSVEGFKNLEVLCDRFGSRFGGTEGERGAIEYLLSKYEEYGLENVHKEEFIHNGWIRGDASLKSITPAAQEHKCISLPYNLASSIEAELIYVGSGTPDEYLVAGEDIHGKIVMANALSPAWYPRGVHRAEKLGRAIAGGAVGFIWMRWEPGLLEETGATRWGKPVEIPCIGVSREVGETLIRMQKLGPVRVRIDTTDTVRPAPTANVIAEITGRTDPDKVMIIGAHFDGHDIAPGAMDDGAGAMVVMETARALARHKELIGKTVRFIAFPIEEIGLGGSYAYVAQHESELDRVEFMWNLDGAGSSMAAPGIVLYGHWPRLFKYFREIGKDMNTSFKLAHAISMYSDHFPFQLKGLPTGRLMDFDDSSGVRGWGHTAADTLDKVPPLGIQSSAALMARIVLHMLNRKQWPVGRISEAQAQKTLGPVWLEVLKLEKRWPFAEFTAPIVR